MPKTEYRSRVAPKPGELPTRLPWSKFEWDRFRSDEALARCSLEAKGAWMMLLCFASTDEAYGHITADGIAADPDQIGFMLGISPEKSGQLLSELERARVFSRRSTLRPNKDQETIEAIAALEADGLFVDVDQNAIFSRRMVRDLHLYRTNVRNGAKGGNPQVRRRSTDEVGATVEAGVNPPVNPPVNPGVGQGVKAKEVLDVLEDKSTPEATLQGADRAVEAVPPKAEAPPPTDLFGEAPKPTARQRCYGEGIQILAQLTKTALPAGRDQMASLIGGFLRQAGDDADLVLSILVDTGETPPRNPVPWIKGCISSRLAKKPASEAKPGPRLVVDVTDPHGIKRWCQDAGFTETTGDDRRVGGWLAPDGMCVIDQVARQVAEKARLPYPWTGDWTVFGGWLNEGFKPKDIYSVIEWAAQQPDYKAPATLLRFDKLLRNRRAAA